MCKAAHVSDPMEMPAWAELVALAQRPGPIKSLISQDRSFLRLSAAGISADFSRQRVDLRISNSLLALVEEAGVTDLRDCMFRGDPINSTENRQVLHTALRDCLSEAENDPADQSLSIAVPGVCAEVQRVLAAMRLVSEQIRSGQWVGATGKTINRVINIGIGGSDLGPAMAYQALHGFVSPELSCAFVSNVDPTDIKMALEKSDPERTLFIVVSKTFTTEETMINAGTAKAWMIDSLPLFDFDKVMARHFIAVSTNTVAVSNFGIVPSNTFVMWDWVGGRYSMASAVGLSTMIAVGPQNFDQMLRGARDMDEHFRTARPSENMPILMGAVAVWNRDFLNIETTAVLPYSQHLAKFPAYLQQLTMESNGKRVRKDGDLVRYNTGAIFWGEPGTNGQHSFYQLLHQGTSVVACDIIVVAREGQESNPAQAKLVANAFAQASVLSVGVTQDELRSDGNPEHLLAHKEMPGDRPVSLLMLDRLNPYTLGALVALYEHSVFVQGAIWGINSFDQWGVEFGKKVASGISRSFGQNDLIEFFDQSTQHSIREYLRMSGSD